MILRYILFMLKGISLQLNGISNYLEGQLRQGKPSWESFHLNTQKNTFEMVKLVRIVFNQLEEYLPRDVGQAYDRASGLMKQYFQNRPKGEVEEESEHSVEYDEVQHFLQNKPQITINEEERGELFKFLAMNEQNEKNTQIMLESMPRYSCNFSYHPAPQKNRPSFQIGKQIQPLPQILKGNNVNNAPQSKLAPILSQFNRYREKEVQTDITMEPSKGMVVSLRESCEKATEIDDQLQEIDMMRDKNDNGEVNHQQQIQSSSKKKKKSKGIKYQRNDSIIQQMKTVQDRIDNQAAQAELGKGESSSIATSNKMIRKQYSKSNTKGKKQEKRDSSISNSSKKDASKDVTKRASRASKDQSKEMRGRPAQESRFNKEKESIPKHVTPIMETPQQLVPSTSYQTTLQLKEETIINGKSQTIKKSVMVQRLLQFSVQYTIKVQQQLEKTKNHQQNVAQDKYSSDFVQNFKKKSVASRQKMISNKEETNHSDQNIQTFACTMDYPFYRKPSNNKQKCESSLPKIEQRGKVTQEHTNLNKKNLESSPYLRQQKQLKNSSSCQFVNRSLHLPPQSHPNHQNRQQHTESLYLGRSQKQQKLREQHVKVIRQIESLSVLKGQQQLSKVLRGIRHYELIHASLCGGKCVHLVKFYDFLRRKNLGVWLNRRQLQVHKKNIEINGNKH